MVIMSKTVLASYFSDKVGYKDNNLFDGNNWYCELSKRLGGLPYKQRLQVTYKGHSAVGMKGDEGSAGPTHQKMEIHQVFANKLKLVKIKISSNQI